MIQCACDKPLDKIPSWLQGVKVEFVCNNCPNRSTRNIAFVTLTPESPAVSVDEPEIDESEDSLDD